jgi:hypothetical protein
LENAVAAHPFKPNPIQLRDEPLKLSGCISPIVAHSLRGNPLVQPLNYTPFHQIPSTKWEHEHAQNEQADMDNENKTTDSMDIPIKLCFFGQK